MRRECKEQENELIRESLERMLPKEAFGDNKKLLVECENYAINGATVVRFSYDGAYNQIWYTEDDVVDRKGQPYIFTYDNYKYLGELQEGSRLVAVYGGEEEYVLLPVLQEGMIDSSVPDSTRQIDMARALRLPSPLLFGLDEVPIAASPAKLGELERTLSKRLVTNARMIGGTIAFSILAFIILGLIGIFTMNIYIDRYPVPALLEMLAILILWIVFSVQGGRLMKRAMTRFVRSCTVQKKVLFNALEKRPMGIVWMTFLSCFEHTEGELKLVSYQVSGLNLLLPSKLKYGTIITKYSKEEGSKDSVFFAK